MPHSDEKPVYGVLGALSVAGVDAFASPRQRALLLCLLAQESRWASADVLADVMWGDRRPRHPSAALHTQVSRLRDVLRRAGRPEEVLPERRGYRLTGEPSLVDAWRFEDLLRRAGAVPVADRAAVYGEALALWRGRAFEEIADHPAAQLTAARLEELRLAAIEDRAAALLYAGDPAAAATELAAFTAAHPLRERAVELLMTALYRAGRQSDALAAFEEYRAGIADELGLDPTPALRALQADILNQAVPAGRRPPPAASLPAVPLSTLVGRDEALADLVRHVRDHRLVTLVGPGGVGKTRLATHALPRLADAFPDGVWWCDLAVVTSGAVQSVASALGVAERSGVSLEGRLREFLTGRRCLIVLDNCEHLAAEAAHVAALLATGGADVHVVATSREPLGVDGEHLFTVEPLERDAVPLFLDRARAHGAPLGDEPDVRETVAAICRRLDGLPLAIELAAARTRSLTVAEIFAQLRDEGTAFLSNPRRDAAGRHRDMGSVVDWSYRLLDRPERALLARLSVFAGPFDRDAAAAACASGDASGASVGALLGGLVDKSLVVVARQDGGTRYRLLETVREFGAGRLAPEQERRGREWHARHCLEVVRRADRLLWGPEEQRGRRAIDADLAELRAAHRFLRDTGDVGNLLSLSATLTWYLTHRPRSELYRWAEAAIASAGAPAHPDYAPACAVAGYGAWQRGDHAYAADLVKLGLDGRGPTGLLHYLAAQLEMFKGRMAECLRLNRLAVETFAAEGNRGRAEQAELVTVLAHAYQDAPEAEALGRRFRKNMYTWAAPSMVAWGEFAVGEALQGRDPGEAMECFDRAVEAAASVGSDLPEGVARVAALAVHVRNRPPERALALVPPLLDHWARRGVWHQQWLTLRLLAEALSALAPEGPGRDTARTAAALIGAHDASATAGPVYGADVGRLDDARERLRATLGDDRYEEALRHGAAIGDQGALALARSLMANL